MRTTVNLDDHLLEQLKTLSARTRRSMGELLDDALRAMLARSADRAAPGVVALPVYGGSGLQPGVDLEDKDGLAELLGDDDVIRAAP